MSSSARGVANPFERTAPGAAGGGAAEGNSNGRQRLGSSRQRPGSCGEWHEVADLRIELAEDTPLITRLAHPLPARVVELTPGRAALDLIDVGEQPFGLLVLDGLLFVELASGRAHIGWLVGGGDLLRPSGMGELALTERSRWQALSRVRLAVLDRDFGVRAGGVPIVSRALLRRATRTASWLLAKSLIISAPVIEERLLLIFALLGERWGTVTPEGIALKLPLTQANLAALCGARRPSVTTALRSLEREGLLSCRAKGAWLLRRAESGDGSRPSCFADYERSLGFGLDPPPLRGL
ncbi:MAG: Crp/Fnr family transcriptional regulator [Candidatus Woesearchaeota archaeon]